MSPNSHSIATVLVFAFTISGCSYTAETNINPATNVYTNYSDPVPGRYALYVDAEEMADDFRVSGIGCSAHKYPVDARNAFAVSVERTLQNLVEDLEVVPYPLDRSALRARDIKGMILVKVEELDIELTVIPGFWSSEMKADAEVTAGLVVDSADGRLMGTTVDGDDDYMADAGGACKGGAIAIGKAVEAAMKETLERLGERFSNSPRLR